MAGRSNDGLVYVALVLSALAAILSLPADASVTREKLAWLLMQGGTVEMMSIVGVAGGPPKFPVSP